jgi:hypothetical protein
VRREPGRALRLLQLTIDLRGSATFGHRSQQLGCHEVVVKIANFDRTAGRIHTSVLTIHQRPPGTSTKTPPRDFITARSVEEIETYLNDLATTIAG